VGRLDFVSGSGWCGCNAAIRPRFGAGVKTAVIAGLAVWFFVGLLHAIGESPMGFMPQQLMVIGTCVALIALPVATVAGAYVYKESRSWKQEEYGGGSMLRPSCFHSPPLGIERRAGEDVADRRGGQPASITLRERDGHRLGYVPPVRLPEWWRATRSRRCINQRVPCSTGARIGVRTTGPQ